MNTTEDAEGQAPEDAPEPTFRGFLERHSRAAIAVAVLAALAIAYFVATALFDGSGKGDGAESAGTATVAVAKVERREFPVVLQAPGTVTPFNSVSVRPRISGELLSVHFTEGDDVREGQVLARIDPRPMRAALRQAQASLRRDRTRLENAEIQYRRSEALIEKGFVTKSALDTKRAEMEQARAESEASRGAVESAALELEYTTIRSPISGRAGFRLIDPGSLVSATEASTIVNITQQQPIAVVFSLPQKDLAAVGGGLADGLPVELTDGRSEKVIANGRVTTFDNAIDRESGTFEVKASFANLDRSLWPGQFVQVRLLVDTVSDGIVVPAEAVQRGPDGDFVFVVSEKDQTARMQPVTVALRVDGEALIEKGLKGGETVVIDGQYGLRSGMKVRIAKKDSGS